jgi:proton glutamate symport protein
MNTFKIFINKIFTYLQNPWAIFLGVAAGIVIGIFFKDTAQIIGPWGTLYIDFLSMCIIPIIVTAIISSIGTLLKKKEAGFLLKKYILIVLVGYLIATSLGVAFSYIGQPGKNLPLSTRVELGKLITGFKSKNTNELTPEKIIYVHKQVKEQKMGIYDFMVKMIPQNIFSALSKGENLKILFFALILGVALGLIPDKLNQGLMNDISGFFQAFQKIISVALIVLPLALACIISEQIAHFGGSILIVLIKYLIMFFTLFLIFFAINVILMKIILKSKIFDSLKAFKSGLIIAFGSTNSYLAIPSLLKEFKNTLNLDENITKLFLPISISTFAFGSAMYFVINTLFFAQLYDVPISFTSMIIVIIGSIFASMATIGAPALIKISFFSITFFALNMPIAPAVAIILTISPMIEPFSEVWDLFTNNVVTTYLATRKMKEKEPLKDEKPQIT